MSVFIEFLTFIMVWYNIPFTLAMVAFFGLSALQFMGLGHDHDADADADLHLDVDHDMDIHLDHDLDHDVDHDVDGAVGWSGALQFLGVGHAPVTMILLVLLGSFAALGWLMNQLAFGLFAVYPGWLLPLVMIISFAVSSLFTSRIALFIGRMLPAFSSTATSLNRLVSRRGRVISQLVDEQYGQVKVRDPSGTAITVFATVDPDKPPISRDQEVLLVEYDTVKKLFIVVPWDD